MVRRAPEAEGGGCGGQGGIGGQQGGASIPLVLLDSAVTMEGRNDILVPGPGGSGRSGGPGATGGPGGAGGGPFTVTKILVSEPLHWYCGWVPGNGGAGGAGGQGGAGSGGAGGNGGPSVGFALIGTAEQGLGNGRGVYDSQPGPGGGEGQGAQNTSEQCKGADGAKGLDGGGSGEWRHVWQ